MMNDKKPDKVVKPSALDELMAEIRQWRGKRDVKRRDKIDEYVHHVPKRKRKRKSRGIGIGAVGILGDAIMGLAMMVFGLIRFAVFPLGILAIIWFMSDIDIDIEMNPETTNKVESVTKSLNVEDLTKKFEELSAEVKKGFHISIEDKDGDVFEWGTKQEPVTTPKPDPSSE